MREKINLKLDSEILGNFFSKNKLYGEKKNLMKRYFKHLLKLYFSMVSRDILTPAYIYNGLILKRWAYDHINKKKLV